METKFGLYPRFYAKRKAQLFPIIEKYSGKSIDRGENHKNVINLYFELLRDNPGFKAEVDALIASQRSKLANVNKGETRSAAGLMVTAIAEGVGSIFDFATTKTEANAQSEAQFMEAVLNEQKKNDTTKILVVTGVTLLFVGMGVYLVLKLKK
jgi:hypothetical protein